MKRNSFLTTNIKSDLQSSITVFLIALPLCLGISLASGAPMFAGIISGIVGGGPAAGLTAVVLSGLTQMPSFSAFLLALVLAGIFQIILGYLKAGIIGDYIPSSVITGMLAAIGLIIILKQIPHAVGYDIDIEGDEEFLQQDGNNTFTELLIAFKKISPLSFLIAIIGILIQFFWNKITFYLKFLKFAPAPLIVVLIGCLLNSIKWSGTFFSNIENNGLVNLPIANSYYNFIKFFNFPDFSVILNYQVWILAVTIAIIASIETLLSLEAIDKLDPNKNFSPTNRELKAQGVGNIICGFIGGLPITSVIVRSSANLNSGAKTKLSSILHGVFLLLAVIFIPIFINKIPLSALASILIFTGFKLASPKLFINAWKEGKNYFFPFIITVISILLSDLLKGIAVGIFISIFYILKNNYHKSFYILKTKNQYYITLRKDISFLNKGNIKIALKEIKNDDKVIIDTINADFIDKDIIEMFKEFKQHAIAENISIEIKKGKINYDI